MQELKTILIVAACMWVCVGCILIVIVILNGIVDSINSKSQRDPHGDVGVRMKKQFKKYDKEFKSKWGY